MGFAAIAAAALLLVLLPEKERSVSTLNWLPLSAEGPSLRSSVEAIANKDLAAGLDAYAARDLDQAITLLERAEASEQMETIRKIFLASALAWSGNHAEAVSVLQTINLRTLPDPWGGEAHWTLYVALEKSGQTASADSLLRILAQERGDVGDRARRLVQP
jgi:hypothetical protein